MTAKVQISDAELEVLKSLWEKSPQTSPEIVADVQTRNAWAMATVKSLLVRLVKKQAVSQECEDARTFFYRPLLGREEYLKSASRNFLVKFFDGSPRDLLSFLVDSEKLSAADIQELQQMLKQKDQQK